MANHRDSSRCAGCLLLSCEVHLPTVKVSRGPEHAGGLGDAAPWGVAHSDGSIYVSAEHRVVKLILEDGTEVQRAGSLTAALSGWLQEAGFGSGLAGDSEDRLSGMRPVCDGCAWVMPLE